MDVHSSMAGYLDRLDGFRQADKDREQMVTELVQAYQELQTKYSEKCDDYNNEIESRRMWQTKAKTTQVSLNDQKNAANSNPFVTVILDGDGAIFQDSLLAMGRDGGAEAAHLLNNELKAALRTMHPDDNTNDWSITVQIILNMQGLSAKLHACQIINRPQDLSTFAAAFSLAQPLFSVVDVGSGKERADHKVRETLRLYFPMANCKHIFFGPCHDTGYLPVLEPYKRDVLGAKLTLVETTPSEPGFQQLKFQHVNFPEIFRTQNLPAKPNMPVYASPTMTHAIPLPVQNTLSASNKPLTTNTSAGASIPKSVSPAPSSTSAGGERGTWASIGKAGGAPKSISIAPKKTVKRRYILMNAYGARIDEDLPRQDPSAFSRFSKRVAEGGNFCNNFHVFGKCDAGVWCDYQHGEKLSGGEQLVLLHKIRSLPCASRGDCVDVDCALGHHCKFGSNCNSSNCRFSYSHGMDMDAAKRLYADGSEDWIQEYIQKHSGSR